MGNNKWLAEPIGVSVSLGLLGSCKKDHTMGWELLRVMSAVPEAPWGAGVTEEYRVAHAARHSGHTLLAVGSSDLKPWTEWLVGQKVFGFFHTILRKHPNGLFGQPDTCCCRYCRHNESVPESARLAGRAWCLKSDATWIQGWIPSLSTWASYRLFWSFRFFIRKMRS